MYILVGLGNPDDQYRESRHNTGFLFVDWLAKRQGVSFSRDKDLEIADLMLCDKKIFAIKPMTYMNASGRAVKSVSISHKVSANDIIIVHDELDIAFGNFKISFDKNTAGHRGVASISSTIKTKAFWRLRIGIGNRKLVALRKNKVSEKKEAISAFVLARFSSLERKRLGDIFTDAIQELEKRVCP